jgi:hypothetical protein
VTAVHRSGRVSSERIYPDESIVRLCAQTESRNAVLFSTIGRPDFRARWRKSINDLSYTLEGNSVWKTGTLQYLDRIARDHPSASVAIHVYNPMNILVHLHMATRDSESGYLPAMSVVVDDGDSTVRVLLGRLSWSGIRPPSPELIVRQVFGDPSVFLITQTVHTHWEYEEEVCRHFGLSYGLLEVLHRPGAPPEFRQFILDDGIGRWVPVAKPDESFGAFVAQSGEYFRDLGEWLACYTNL